MDKLYDVLSKYSGKVAVPITPPDTTAIKQGLSDNLADILKTPPKIDKSGRIDTETGNAPSKNS